MGVIRSNLAILLLLLVFINSCDDSSPTGSGGNDADTDFPSGIGMLWKYQVYDSLTQTTDTVWLSITDTITNNSNQLFIERREKHFTDNSYGLQYLHINGDTLEIFDDTVGMSANERIVFPLELGSSWSGPTAIFDTSSVTLIGQIDVPAGRFNNGARIDRMWGIGFEGGGDFSQTWLVPGVGIVNRYRLSEIADGGGGITVTINEAWELIEYDLSTFGLNQFPNKVGSEWIYEQIDSTTTDLNSILVEFDTVIITIVDSGKFESGESYTIWETVSRLGTDSQFVVTGEERISFQFDTIYFSHWDFYYDFPLAVGRTWGIEFILPVPILLDKESVFTPFQHFASTFHTKAGGGAFNSYWSQDDWLVPGVGVVKSRRRQFGFFPWMNRTRTLIDYNLAN